jgi:hypothetical protein
LNKLKRQLQILPLLLLTAYCIDAIFTAVRGTVIMAGISYDYELTTKHYIAFVAIAVNIVIYFFFRPLYKFTFILTVAIGLFNLMTFSALETTQRFAFKSLKVSFQPSAFFAGLLGYMINFKRLNKFIIDNLTNEPKLQKE